MKQLTSEDWEEIYYALEYKLDWVQETQNDLKGRQWQQHLRAILAKIGPDGSYMTEENTR